MGECNIVSQQYWAISVLRIGRRMRFQRIDEGFCTMINVDIFLAKHV